MTRTEIDGTITVLADRYFVRRGRTFQLDAEGKEIPARDLGDLSVPAIAALHPALVESALSARSEHDGIQSV